MEEQKNNVLKLLESGKESAVILAGEMGTASWMAREIIESATSDGLCYESLWVSVTKLYDTKLLYKAIYDQLSSGSIPEEWEYEDENTKLEKAASDLEVHTVDWEKDEHQNAEQEVEEETIDNLKEKIQAQLEQRTVLLQGAKYLLLVLDYEGSNMDNNEFQQSISPEHLSINHNHLRIIITRCKTGSSGADNDVQPVSKIELGVLEPEESLSVFEKSVGLKDDEIRGFKQLFEVIAKERSLCLPAPITVIGEALKYIARHDNGPLTLEAALLKAAYYEKPSQAEHRLHYCAYDMMISDVKKNCFWHSLQFVRSYFGEHYKELISDVKKNCFWHSLQFVRNYGGVHYNELITHWILEGYLNPFDEIEKAYQVGHLVLMELIDCAMLKMQENNIVVVEGAALNMIDTPLHGFGGTANLGLVRVFENGEGFGRVTHMAGMIKTLCNPKIMTKVSTFLIDGAPLNCELCEKYFSNMPKLRVLGVFNSTYKPLISSLSSLEKLHVLVLRNCDLLDDTTHISNLKTLRVLEISDSRPGNSSLMSMPKIPFDEMTHLQSLNLSGLQITSLPSLSNLRELRLLILRRCTKLKKLQSLQGLGKLEILDLSGAQSLENFDDIDFTKNQNLELIDLSDTKIRKLLVIRCLKDLTQILLKGSFNQIRQLPILKLLTNLQILDLSGASKFTNFHYKDSIERLNHLKILNLSKTKIKQLPPMPCNLSELNLSGCSELVKLPSIASLKILELLDVSDAPNLEKIEDTSFEHLSCLHYLNFSNTRVEKLPSLSNLRNLCQLLVKNCTSLTNLPEMEGLKRLEELDLRGYSASEQEKEKIGCLKRDMPCLKLSLD